MTRFTKATQAAVSGRCKRARVQYVSQRHIISLGGRSKEHAAINQSVHIDRQVMRKMRYQQRAYDINHGAHVRCYASLKLISL